MVVVVLAVVSVVPFALAAAALAVSVAALTMRQEQYGSESGLLGGLPFNVCGCCGMFVLCQHHGERNEQIPCEVDVERLDGEVLIQRLLDDCDYGREL